MLSLKSPGGGGHRMSSEKTCDDIPPSLLRPPCPAGPMLRFALQARRHPARKQSLKFRYLTSDRQSRLSATGTVLSLPVVRTRCGDTVSFPEAGVSGSGSL